jgi:hypothetical protein
MSQNVHVLSGLLSLTFGLPSREVLGGAVDEALGSTRGGSHAMKVRGLQEILAKTFAPIEQLFYHAVVVHAVPPDEKGSCIGCHQHMLWTTYLQFNGTPRETPP